MSPAIEQLYDYFVGLPRPERRPEELQDNPMLAHGQYAFPEGLRLGYLPAVECLGPELLGS